MLFESDCNKVKLRFCFSNQSDELSLKFLYKKKMNLKQKIDKKSL